MVLVIAALAVFLTIRSARKYKQRIDSRLTTPEQPF